MKKEKGITLIALIITIIVLIILAGISINLVLGENGLFNKAKSASVETKKARFVEDAALAYSEAYIENAENSNSNAITIQDIVSKLKSSYGYTDEQIILDSNGVTDITLSDDEINLKSGETKEVTVTLGNGAYYAKIENFYYPITVSNSEIKLGEGVESLTEWEGTTSTIEATTESEIIDVTVKDTTITITAKEGQKGEATIIVIYGKITKTITVTVKVEVRQGDEVDLREVTVEVNNEQHKLAQGWKYFYDDKENNKVWLIYSDIMEKEALQTSGTIHLYGNNVYSSSNRQDLIDYLNGEGSYSTVWEHIKTGIKNALDVKEISIQDNEMEVKGSPNVELFQKAYDKMYPSEQFEVQWSDSNGWLFRLGKTGNFQAWADVTDFSNKPLFFINKEYWLAGFGRGKNLCIVKTYRLYITEYHITSCGARPVISIPKTVFEQLIK